MRQYGYYWESRRDALAEKRDYHVNKIKELESA
jgi:hypothetical protein